MMQNNNFYLQLSQHQTHRSISCSPWKIHFFWQYGSIKKKRYCLCLFELVMCHQELEHKMWEAKTSNWQYIYPPQKKTKKNQQTDSWTENGFLTIYQLHKSYGGNHSSRISNIISFSFLNQPSINSQQQSGMKYVHLAYSQMTTFLKVTQ